LLPGRDEPEKGDGFAANGTDLQTPAGPGASGGAAPGSPGASGSPSGTPGAGPGGSPRPGVPVSTAPGSATTKAPAGGVQGTPGPRRTTNGNEKWCETMDLAMARTSGSGSPPRIPFEACLNDYGETAVYVNGKFAVAQTSAYQEYRYKARIIVETFECNGPSDKVDTQDTGVVERSGKTYLTNEINIYHYQLNSYTVRARLVSLEIFLDGVRWTATPTTLNSPCHNPWYP
jgi:hypothetical protein